MEMRLTQPHEMTDPAKVASLAADMTANGWTGRPVLASASGQALTGSHRIAAAEIAGIEVPFVLVPDGWDWTDVQGDFEELSASFGRFIAELREEGEDLPEGWEEIRDLLAAE
jgi:ParB-like chromosome segregation protein Spo0J